MLWREVPLKRESRCQEEGGGRERGKEVRGKEKESRDLKRPREMKLGMKTLRGRGRTEKRGRKRTGRKEIRRNAGKGNESVCMQACVGAQ